MQSKKSIENTGTYRLKSCSSGISTSGASLASSAGWNVWVVSRLTVSHGDFEGGERLEWVGRRQKSEYEWDKKRSERCRWDGMFSQRMARTSWKQSRCQRRRRAILRVNAKAIGSFRLQWSDYLIAGIRYPLWSFHVTRYISPLRSHFRQRYFTSKTRKLPGLMKGHCHFNTWHCFVLDRPLQRCTVYVLGAKNIAAGLMKGLWTPKRLGRVFRSQLPCVSNLRVGLTFSPPCLAMTTLNNGFKQISLDRGTGCTGLHGFSTRDGVSTVGDLRCVSKPVTLLVPHFVMH